MFTNNGQTSSFTTRVLLGAGIVGGIVYALGLQETLQNIVYPSPPQKPETEAPPSEEEDPYQKKSNEELLSSLATNVAINVAGDLGIRAVTNAVTKTELPSKKPVTVTDDVVKVAEEATSKLDDAIKTVDKATKVGDDIVEQGVKALDKGSDIVADSSKAVAKATKASKASSLLSKLKGTPADLIVTVIAVILQEVLDLDPEAFKPCSGTAYDLSSLPPEASIAISFVPFLGDLFSLLQPVLCFQTGCKEGYINEAGLCYEPCREGYSSDGVVMCYKNYPAFENNGALHTVTSITKAIKLDTGTIPTECGPDEEQQGGLCYPKCPEGWTGVLDRCWKNCPGGTVQTLGRCEKDSYGRGVGTLPEVYDDGYYNTSWGSVGCTDGRPFQISGYDDCYKTWISVLKSRCPGGKELQDGLCYEPCRPGFFGQGPVCWSHEGPVNQESYSRGSGTLLKCGNGQDNIAGLCYGQVPLGYSRQVLGTLDQTCPDGTTDFGVGCIRESYARPAGLIPLEVVVKDRVEGFSY